MKYKDLIITKGGMIIITLGLALGVGVSFMIKSDVPEFYGLIGMAVSVVFILSAFISYHSEVNKKLGGQ